MLRIAAFCLLLLQVQAEGRIEVDDHEPIVVQSMVEVPDGWSALVEWEVPLPARSREIDGGARVHVWAPPGEYEIAQRVTLARIGEGQRIEFQSLREVYHLVVRGERPPPDPPPGPKPPPVPTPNPTESVDWVIVLRDLSTDTPEEAEVLLRLRNWNQWPNPPPQVLILDRDQEDPDGNPVPAVKQYADLLPEGAGSPYVFGVAKSGRVLRKFDLPATVEETVETVK